MKGTRAIIENLGVDMFHKEFIKSKIEQLLDEDLLHENFFYLQKLSGDLVRAELKIKSDAMLAGVDVFEAVFEKLGASVVWKSEKPRDGQFYNSGSSFFLEIPFNVALSGERLALNLLAQASQVATVTHSLVMKTKSHGIKILDTRKTIPGLRWLQKYAVRVGGGYNHRMGQTDVWMIKDNHKKYFGSLAKAYEFFSSVGTQYNPIHAEIHSLNEFDEAIRLGLKFLMLDNFSPTMIHEVVTKKPNDVTLELSGGINSSNIENFLIKGVDAISLGSITHSAPHLDFSLKFEKVSNLK